MTKIKRLELEKSVLKNVIECLQEQIELAERTGREPSSTLSAIKARLDYENRMELVMEHGEPIDFRRKAETLGGCEYRFELLGVRTVLNDGLVVGID